MRIFIGHIVKEAVEIVVKTVVEEQTEKINKQTEDVRILSRNENRQQYDNYRGRG